MSRKDKFLESIKHAKVEKDLELLYKNELCYYYKDAKISNPYNTDGLIESGKLKLVMELKYDENFKNKDVQCITLIQSLYYIKKFQENEPILPNVILIGDKDEVFVIENNLLKTYLDENIDWSLPPSSAAIKNPKLIMKMINDNNISPFVYDIDKNFDFQDVVNDINKLVKGLKPYVSVTEKNISKIFDYFALNVIKSPNKYDANELVSIFINLIINPNSNYLLPYNRNILVSNTNHIEINNKMYESFIKHFKQNYTQKEKEKFTEIADRLIEDLSRRYKGEFYTPTIWVDESQKLISKNLGEDWREKYVVWDCAWGTGNLTRDYYFKELYCSTLNESDLNIGSRYNINAIKFQYDFLNDDIDMLECNLLGNNKPKMPAQLYNSLKNKKPILFYINPPFGTATEYDTKNSAKSGIAKTKMNTLMKNNQIKRCTEQLYTQFLYRILLLKRTFALKDVAICVFSKPLFMSGSSFTTFREQFLDNFEFKEAMLFKACHFSDVSGAWGISFSVWTSGKTKNKHVFKHTLKDLFETDNSISRIVDFGYKDIYNLDKEISFSDYIKRDLKKLPTYEGPQLTSGLNYKEIGSGKIVSNALGYYVNVGNSVYTNTKDVILFTAPASKSHGISVIPENFTSVMTNFASRKVITGKYATWINDKDEYRCPDFKNSIYYEWMIDCVVYSLFNTSSQQTSLRNISYKNNNYNIQNEFFFMSHDDIVKLACKYDNDDVYKDAKSFNTERYVYQFLQKNTLSNEAKLVLEKAKYLVSKTFPYRDTLSLIHPEYHLSAWDAGWYQINIILKTYDRNELDDFKRLYRTLESKVRFHLYELGVLKN
jgi:hypothetical protein